MTGPPAAPDLLSYVRTVIARAVAGAAADDVPAPADADRAHSGVFVTLRSQGKLRGCMGTLADDQPLPTAVRRAAVTAALHDPRFPPLRPSELVDVHIELSILSPPTPMRSLDDLELGRHGVIVRSGDRRGLFLPQVAIDHQLDKETLLARCCAEKAGLAPDAWRYPEVEVLLFEAAVLNE